MASTAFVVDGVRSPFGSHGGILAPIRADDLAAAVVAALMARTDVPPDAIDDVIFGCANQAGEDNRNVARMAALLSGLPISVPGVTVNRLCGSSLQSLNDAARLIAAGEADLVIAGGVEHMTRSPWVLPKPDRAFGRGPRTAEDTTLGWRLVNPRMDELYGTLAMGQTAEKVAERYGVTREQQDEFAAESQRRAAEAKAAGRLADEIIPVTVAKHRKTGEDVVASEDEHPRPDVTATSLARLRPVFQKDGTVTAGNASGLNDGSVALLVASEAAVERFGLKPKVRYVTSAVAGVEPSYMGIGPVPASRRALERAGLRSSDIDVAEINEAFAAQALPCLAELELDPERVNVNGGAIALGHPLGASGGRLALTLTLEMQRRGARYGLASMCIGVGQGIATILERV